MQSFWRALVLVGLFLHRGNSVLVLYYISKYIVYHNLNIDGYITACHAGVQGMLPLEKWLTFSLLQLDYSASFTSYLKGLPSIHSLCP